ncbi:hypothetical protein AAFF_G00133530 [Aldrovandia affinis]|uniref:Uncharacterized protein n=1 Tax=Aldrovandia affinis TaxID=143900 RepID=A0AAD7RQT1_9TELE|nr:hypothetical protein AAFF_G00133530 [Aldrovandia affinis]
MHCRTAPGLPLKGSARKLTSGSRGCAHDLPSSPFLFLGYREVRRFHARESQKTAPPPIRPKIRPLPAPDSGKHLLLQLIVAPPPATATVVRVNALLSQHNGARASRTLALAWNFPSRSLFLLCFHICLQHEGGGENHSMTSKDLIQGGEKAGAQKAPRPPALSEQLRWLDERRALEQPTEQRNSLPCVLPHANPQSQDDSFLPPTNTHLIVSFHPVGETSQSGYDVAPFCHTERARRRTDEVGGADARRGRPHQTLLKETGRVGDVLANGESSACQNRYSALLNNCIIRPW